MLSDEECREIWRTALARCHPTNDISVAGVFAARAAYALGVERTRLVKPLVWTWDFGSRMWRSGNYRALLQANDVYRPALSEEFAYNWLGSGMSVGEAKSVCQAHNEAYVLSMLEPV